jgi:hypothetical protein
MSATTAGSTRSSVRTEPDERHAQIRHFDPQGLQDDCSALNKQINLARRTKLQTSSPAGDRGAACVCCIFLCTRTLHLGMKS